VNAEGDAPEDAFLSEEAKADAAPVADKVVYQRRKPWKPWQPGTVGFIVNNAGSPVAFLKWPKKRNSKDFFKD
jgi:hypothetical protein